MHLGMDLKYHPISSAGDHSVKIIKITVLIVQKVSIDSNNKQRSIHVLPLAKRDYRVDMNPWGKRNICQI